MSKEKNEPSLGVNRPIDVAVVYLNHILHIQAFKDPSSTLTCHSLLVAWRHGNDHHAFHDYRMNALWHFFLAF